MNSTFLVFAHPTQDDVANDDNLKRFLLNYPEAEFWRFFVERDRYDYRQQLLRALYSEIANVALEEMENIPFATIETEVKSKDLTVGDIYSFASANNNTHVLNILNNTFHLENRRSEKLFDIINQHQGWLGFEENESGYLLHVTQGLRFIISAIVNEELFDVNFIKKLHKLCTEYVKNMGYGQTPGEFRKKHANWRMKKETDTCDGLRETIDYLKAIEELYEMGPKNYYEVGNSASCFTITCAKYSEPKKTPFWLSHFRCLQTESGTLAKGLWDALESGEEKITFVAEEDGINSGEFLEKISNHHISKLEYNLKLAVSKHQKLTAIFSYLKYTVLHHPFQDGVGRTYSMLLLQYLLMRENLLPVLIKDTNIIPGYSVQELVDEYLRAEKEMENILEDSSYINSAALVDYNINTVDLLAKITPAEQEVFNASLNIYKEAKELYLSMTNECIYKMR